MTHSRELPSQSFFKTGPGKIIGWLFLLSVLFPFIRTSPLETDVQPAALILSILIILGTRDRRIPMPIAILAFPAVFSVFVAVLGSLDMVAFRSIGNYLSLFLISMASYFTIRDSNLFSAKFLLKVILIWLAVGVLQTFVSRDFLTQILPRVSTTENRGVVGLAPEPTFYGIACIFFFLLALLQKEYRRTNSILAILQIILLARSSMAILFLLIFASSYLVFSLSLKILVLSAGSVGLATYIALTYFEKQIRGWRIYDLIVLAFQSPILILTRDASGNERFLHIYFALLGFFENNFLPSGFGTFSGYVASKIADYHEIIVNLNKGNRIMSAYGSAFYELGFLGLAIPIALSMGIFRYFKNDRRMKFTYFAFLNLILFSAIQIAFPPLALLLGYMCAKSSKDS